MNPTLAKNKMNASQDSFNKFLNSLHIFLSNCKLFLFCSFFSLLLSRYVSRYMCLVCMGGVSADEIIVWNNFKFHLEARATTKLRWGGAATAEWG